MKRKITMHVLDISYLPKPEEKKTYLQKKKNQKRSKLYFQLGMHSHISQNTKETQIEVLKIVLYRSQ